jgi:hypothetical protein
MLLWTLALFLVVEPVVGHIIEPMVYGHSTGLSPVAVVASATFWTALWGPIGLVLATPLTVCLVVLGRHVERLEFLDVMFGDRPALSPPEIFYQRMLAGDPTEASEKAEEFLKERTLSSYLRDSITSSTQIRSSAHTVGEHAPYLPDLNKDELPPEWRGEHPVLCVAGRSLIDEAAAIMLGQLSTSHGLTARIEGAEALSTTNVFRLDTTGVAIVCLVYLDPSAPVHMRYSVRRLRRKLPKATILLGCWMKDIDPAVLEQIRHSTKADLVAASLGEAVKLCIEAVDEKSHRRMLPKDGPAATTAA